MDRAEQGTIVRWIRNFLESDIPFPRRIAVTLRNISIRFTHRQTCCGHDGEPGC